MTAHKDWGSNTRVGDSRSPGASSEIGTDALRSPGAPNNQRDVTAREFRLSQLQNRLAQLAGEALKRTDEDPKVLIYDRYGGAYEIGDIDIDWTPETLAEADQDIRHPVIRILPPEHLL